MNSIFNKKDDGEDYKDLQKNETHDRKKHLIVNLLKQCSSSPPPDSSSPPPVTSSLIGTADNDEDTAPSNTVNMSLNKPSQQPESPENLDLFEGIRLRTCFVACSMGTTSSDEEIRITPTTKNEEIHFDVLAMQNTSQGISSNHSEASKVSDATTMVAACPTIQNRISISSQGTTSTSLSASRASYSSLTDASTTNIPPPCNGIQTTSVISENRLDSLSSKNMFTAGKMVDINKCKTGSKKEDIYSHPKKSKPDNILNEKKSNKKKIKPKDEKKVNRGELENIFDRIKRNKDEKDEKEERNLTEQNRKNPPKYNEKNVSNVIEKLKMFDEKLNTKKK